MRKCVLFFILTFCLYGKLIAGQGCLIGGKIYYSQTGTATFFGFASRYVYNPAVSYDLYPGSCSPGDYTIYANQTSQETLFGFAIDCGYTTDGWATATRGKVWNFDEVQCPLDDYIPLMLLLSGSLGCFIIRKVSYV